jgi:hypothetical protein
MAHLSRFRPAAFSAALVLAALDDVDHAPGKNADKAANRPGGMNVAMTGTALRNCDRPLRRAQLVVRAKHA